MAFALIDRDSTTSPYAAHGFRAGQAFETTEDLYTYFREVAPPLIKTAGSFACGVITMDRLIDSYHLIQERAFCVTIEWDGKQSLAAASPALITFLEKPRS
ncbi:hypothetical protein [Yoonia sp. R2-816]|uniref:hypothetical protein n=1 Tax=Yoonia sp. R2-816 TaxID=3342638 RepID=UPI00372D6119